MLKFDLKSNECECHRPSIRALRGLEVTHCESQHAHIESSPVRAFHLSKPDTQNMLSPHENTEDVVVVGEL